MSLTTLPQLQKLTDKQHKTKIHIGVSRVRLISEGLKTSEIGCCSGLKTNFDA